MIFSAVACNDSRIFVSTERRDCMHRAMHQHLPQEEATYAFSELHDNEDDKNANRCKHGYGCALLFCEISAQLERTVHRNNCFNGHTHKAAPSTHKLPWRPAPRKCVAIIGRWAEGCDARWRVVRYHPYTSCSIMHQYQTPNSLLAHKACRKLGRWAGRSPLALKIPVA